ncbi:MAG: DNA translocase FtsK, partial [Clostridia bacterium]|nr:DNA translocase FtsK [Clostridia bacterium]
IGGGVLGALGMTPLYLLGGLALCYIVAVAALLICVLLLTGISIKAYTDMFGTKVKDKLESVRDAYFSEDEEYEDDEDEEPEEEPEADRQWRKDYSTRVEKKPVKDKKKLSFDELFEVPPAEEPAPAPKPVQKSAAVTAASAAASILPEPEPKRTIKRKSNFLFDVDEEDIPTSFPVDEPEVVPAAPVQPVKKPVRKADKRHLDLIDDTPDDEPIEVVSRPVVPAKPAETAKEKPVAKAAAPSDTPAFKSTAAKENLQPSVEDGEDDDLPLIVPDAPSAEAVQLYLPPSIDCLNKSEQTYTQGIENPESTSKLLEETLASFNISAQVVNYSVGPVVTRYELKPAPGIRVSKIAALADDLAMALAAARVRIEAPIPGKSAVGIEVPNKETATVLLRDIIESPEFKNAKSTSTMAMGKDISGRVVVADLAKMPHMLIAGSTGSGKSVCINDIIISMIYKASPQEVQMILIDPKVVELSVFGNLPHLRIPVVTEPKKAASALRWAVNEMDMRYRKFSEVGSRDLARYNSLMDDPHKKMAKLVIIIDELADLMMVAPEDVEDSICRIAQLGRAAGIHLIVATQRPSADIITGLIKANIPSRCAFAVSSSIDSRIILDATGAEKLLGRGDMLFHPNGSGKPTRCQGAYVSDEEVERIMSHFKKEDVQFDEEVLSEINNEAKGGATGGVFGEGKQEDDLLGEAVRIVMENGQASISMIQRRLRVGYARAARLVDMMEQAKYVSGFDGSKPRQVLITPAEYNRVFGGGAPVPEAEPAPEAPPEDDVPFDEYEEDTP